MSFDKAIQSGEERRKPYRKSKAFDRSLSQSRQQWLVRREPD